MASAARNVSEPPQQLWLDVARPIQPRLPRDRGTPQPRQPRADASQDQMELRMSAAAPLVQPTPAIPKPRPADRLAASQVEAPSGRPSFVKWLLAQSKCGGAVGDLAKAARADTQFPRDGSADDVRMRFGKAGADGDAYAALDDAERAYDRL